MSDLAEAQKLEKRGGHRGFAPFVVLACALSLSGCMNTLSNPVAALSVDRTTTTASVPERAPEAETLSDEATIATAVGLARPGLPYPWSNSVTGAAGVVTDIADSYATGRQCRTFKTSRHGFEGIALYTGSACADSQGLWVLESFQPTS
jgi:outer membrane surface antigen